MFGKKTPTPPWYVQILTHDYSIEGFVDPDHLNLAAISLEKPSSWILSGLTLLQPQLTATGQLESPPSIGKEFATAMDKVVVFIPRDAASQAIVLSKFEYSEHAIQVVALAGTYMLKGQLHPRTQQLPADSFVLLREAQITCQLPNSHWPGLSVPLALVHPTWLQGYLTP